MFIYIKWLVVVLTIFWQIPCTGIASDKIPVFVSIVPQKYFVERIGKDLVDVQVMVSPGASPAIYEPKPQQMVGLSKAKIYFSVGVPFEKSWLDKISAANTHMRIVHTDKGIQKIAMTSHHHHVKEEEHGVGAHDNQPVHHQQKAHVVNHRKTGLDPHIWLSPQLVKIQAKNILVALQEEDPDSRETYEKNFKVFMDEIDELDAHIKKTLAGQKGMRFMVFHPAWGYFAHAYGLQQVPVEIEGKDPKPAQLQKLIHHAKKSGIKVIFVQPQFSRKSAQVVAQEINGAVAVANPLAEDWLDNLRQVTEQFTAALK